MTKPARTLLSTTVLALAAVLAHTPGAAAQDADPDDVASIDAIITAVYDVISGDAGEPHDWDRWHTLFAEGATLSPTGPNQSGGWGRNVLTFEEYAEVADPALMQGFVEAEIGRTVERFGNIAHVFSTYVSFRSRADTEPFARGINSFQLLYDGGRWHVISIFWQAESPAYPIPERYIGTIDRTDGLGAGDELTVPHFSADDPSVNTGGFVARTTRVVRDVGDTSFTLMAFAVGSTATLGAMVNGPFEGTATWTVGERTFSVPLSRSNRGMAVSVDGVAADGAHGGFDSWDWVNVDLPVDGWLPDGTEVRVDFVGDGRTVSIPAEGALVSKLETR